MSENREVCEVCDRPKANRADPMSDAHSPTLCSRDLYGAWGRERCEERRVDWRARATLLRAQVDNLLERERYFVEKLGVKGLGALRGDWAEAIEAHDAKVRADEAAKHEAARIPRVGDSLADLTPEEIPVVRAIEALAAALGHDDPMVCEGRRKHPGSQMGQDVLRVVTRRTIADVPSSTRAGRRLAELRCLLGQVRFLAEHVYRSRQGDLDRLRAETPPQIESLQRGMRDIARALSIPTEPVSTRETGRE